MAWTIDSALEDDLVTVVSRNDGAGYYEIQVGDLRTIISIRLGKYGNSGWTSFDISHAIKTPRQAGAYRASRPAGDYPGYALHLAINGITSYYREAVKAGDKPDEDWLEPW